MQKIKAVSLLVTAFSRIVKPVLSICAQELLEGEILHVCFIICDVSLAWSELSILLRPVFNFKSFHTLKLSHIVW
jgi:hypothetical protein